MGRARAWGNHRSGKKFARPDEPGEMPAAGPCTITRADGTITVIPPITPKPTKKTSRKT